MKLLYIGDVMGRAGREMVADTLPALKREYQVDAVIAQAENVTHGKGLSASHYQELRNLGIDFFTGGNHIFVRPEINPLLEDRNLPIIRPANYPDMPGLGAKLLPTPVGDIYVICLLGQIVGKDADIPMDNPLTVVDGLLEKAPKSVATIVNFHGDYSSEKVVIGHYLDGRVTAVVGDHWHIPTADARLLPKGTAHVTDVGMVGSLNSSLGISTDSIIPRWKDDIQTRNELDETRPWQFNAVLIDIDASTGRARNIERIYRQG